MKFRIPIEGGEDEINMAPMIDMVFLLLIFFMVASHMSKLDRIPVELPVADKSVVPEQTPERQLITIRSKDRSGEEVDIIMNLQPVTIEQVSLQVQKLLAENKDAEVYLRADRFVRHKYVKKVMAACAEGGVANVIFATFESGE